MANEANTGGGGIPGDGDPQSIRDFARWLRAFAASVEKCESLLWQAWTQSLAGWQDSAGEEFRERLRSGTSSTRTYAAMVRKIADNLEEGAEKLEAGQREMAEVVALVIEYDLDVIEGRVYSPFDTGNLGEEVPVTDPARQMGFPKQRAFEEAQRLAQHARDLANPPAGESALDDLAMDVLKAAVFKEGDLAAGRIQDMAKAYQTRYLEQAVATAARSQYQSWLSENARRRGNMPDLAKWFDETADDLADDAVKAANRAADAGLVRRAVKAGGVPALTVIGVTIDLAEGKSVSEALFTAGTGAIGGAGAVWLLGLAPLGPPGWVFAIVGIAGGALGGWLGGLVYPNVRFPVTSPPVFIDARWCARPEE